VSDPVSNPDPELTAESPAASSPEEQQLEALQAELAAAREQVLRANAEMQNVRRRAEQDVEKAHKFALERFAGELLPVVDNLERALAAIPVEETVNREGVELTLKSLLGCAGKARCQPDRSPWGALQSRASPGYCHAGCTARHSQFSGRRHAKRLQPEWPAAASRYGGSCKSQLLKYAGPDQYY
jgi:hypothetical protein